MEVGFFGILYGNHKVTKAQKVGRKLPPPKNTTNTEVKSKEVTHRLSSAKEAVASISSTILKILSFEINKSSTGLLLIILESLSLKDITAADWSDNVALFWPAMLDLWSNCAKDGIYVLHGWYAIFISLV
ncbi:putative tocopherol C-methyltransferase [Helianthus anomalus]